RREVHPQGRARWRARARAPDGPLLRALRGGHRAGRAHGSGGQALRCLRSARWLADARARGRGRRLGDRPARGPRPGGRPPGPVARERGHRWHDLRGRGLLSHGGQARPLVRQRPERGSIRVKGIYLDWNATTPPHPDVLAAMCDAAERAWANPSSVHGAGRRAKAVVESAREILAERIGFSPRDIVFTSGGTEANNLALFRLFRGAEGLLVTSRLEHPSITQAAEALEARGIHVVWLPVPPSGRIDPDDVHKALRESTKA